MKAAAQAQPNIALIKYWGKRDIDLNLPAVGSLSVTLDSLWTRTCVEFDPAFERDELRLNDAENAAETARVSACLDLLRARAGTDWRAHVETHNNFPTGAGLASSASGFAALVRAAATALDLSLDERELSILARRGSGSAARSIFGGFVEMAVGERDDGEDAYAQPILSAADWPLKVVVAVTSRRAKSIGSTGGMELTRRTSPFYGEWVATAPDDLAAARQAVLARDFETLAALGEYSCLKMHGLALASQPGLLYWTGATVECLHRVRALREREGLGVFFTVDAGPQVKAICLPEYAERVAAALADVPGVEDVMATALGEGARVIDDSSIPSPSGRGQGEGC
ncbi:MAG TPA: diphosphomevalonate decarboxylase [Gammaproteobacteria bacterium]|nr:diphosphomevalonate decarboxylase [Gammaproteobacteria bacterium]